MLPFSTTSVIYYYYSKGPNFEQLITSKFTFFFLSPYTYIQVYTGVLKAHHPGIFNVRGPLLYLVTGILEVITVAHSFTHYSTTLHYLFTSSLFYKTNSRQVLIIFICKVTPKNFDKIIFYYCNLHIIVIKIICHNDTNKVSTACIF